MVRGVGFCSTRGDSGAPLCTSSADYCDLAIKNKSFSYVTDHTTQRSWVVGRFGKLFAPITLSTPVMPAVVTAPLSQKLHRLWGTLPGLEPLSRVCHCSGKHVQLTGKSPVTTNDHQQQQRWDWGSKLEPRDPLPSVSHSRNCAAAIVLSVGTAIASTRAANNSRSSCSSSVWINLRTDSQDRSRLSTTSRGVGSLAPAHDTDNPVWAPWGSASIDRTTSTNW